MLLSLFVKNFILIDEIKLGFTNNLTIITGETGSGKSIILGALGLVCGNRISSNSLKDKSKKCIVEATFDVQKHDLKSFFIDNDLDYENTLIVRREILPSGKSRAFINDTPTPVSVLKILGKKLIDIHSQNETAQLSDNNYQLHILDLFSKNESPLRQYKLEFESFRNLNNQLKTLIEKQKELLKNKDYNQFLLDEFEQINLENTNIEEIESEFKTLNNAEYIKQKLSHSIETMENDDIGIIQNIRNIVVNLSEISEFSKQIKDITNRINSSSIELEDILTELHNYNENTHYDQEKIEQLDAKLQVIYSLQKKHSVNSLSQLIEIKEALEKSIFDNNSLDEKIVKTQNKISLSETSLEKLSQKLRKNRESNCDKFNKKLESILENLGIEKPVFKVKITHLENFSQSGKDKAEFLFSANKGIAPQSLSNTASGGEKSRIMLSIKSISNDNSTLIFDEIDTGVSGKIAHKVANIMSEMSKKQQIIAITHLPQIASKGQQHLRVYKDYNDSTKTNIQKLSDEDKIVEIAKMISGDSVSDSAISHARELLAN